PPEAFVNVPQVERAKRCRSYLEAMPPSIARNGGDEQLFEAACTIYRFAVESPDDLMLLQEYNLRSQPAWDDKRIGYKLSEAREKVDNAGEYGKLLGSAGEPGPAQNADAAPKDTADQKGKPERFKIRILTASQLAAAIHCQPSNRPCGQCCRQCG